MKANNYSMLLFNKFYKLYSHWSVPLFSAVMTSGIVAVLLLCSVVFGFMYWKKRKTSSDYCYQQLQQDPI